MFDDAELSGRQFFSLAEFERGGVSRDGDRFTGIGHGGKRRDCILVRGSWTDITSEMARTLGIWDYYTNPPPTPEPSPADKALDDFIAKRKAKRDKAKALEDAGAHIPYEQTTRENERAKALDRALSKAYVHHAEMTDRLMPYRIAP